MNKCFCRLQNKVSQGVFSLAWDDKKRHVWFMHKRREKEHTWYVKTDYGNYSDLSARCIVQKEQAAQVNNHSGGNKLEVAYLCESFNQSLTSRPSKTHLTASIHAEPPAGTGPNVWHQHWHHTFCDISTDTIDCPLEKGYPSTVKLRHKETGKCHYSEPAATVPTLHINWNHNLWGEEQEQL